MKKILIIMMLMVSAVVNAQKSGDSVKVFGKTYEVESVKKVMNLDTDSYEVSIETTDCHLITYSLKNGNRTNIKVKDIRKQKEEEMKRKIERYETCKKYFMQEADKISKKYGL